MNKRQVRVIEPMGEFRLDGMMMRYNVFISRFYNFCKSLGFEAGKIMPSRAFCSDENQGYPIILITKHFGTFPFNHGRVGGIVATDRHGPHADHGKDMVIIQASHVGYDPNAGQFGSYRRLQTEDETPTETCGKIIRVLEWYQNEYDFAKQNIFLSRNGSDYLVAIDNQLLNPERKEGLFINLGNLVGPDPDGEYRPVHFHSTSKVYKAADKFVESLKHDRWKEGGSEKIGESLSSSLFYFKRDVPVEIEGQRHLEYNLLPFMPFILTSTASSLAAAKINTQIEFDRTFRTIVKEQSYHGKKVFFISGLHIDISPPHGQIFPLTKFVPWAAFVKERDGTFYTLEQAELVEKLNQQSTENPDKIDLETAIREMREADEVVIE